MGFTALIAGGIGAAGSIGSALIGSSAAKNASQAQVALGEQALQQQQNIFGQGLDFAKQMYGNATGYLQPYVTAGQSVLPTLKGLITPGPSQNALLSQTPGFQFAQQYGTMAAQNALASKGLGMSAGPLATAISQYNSGLAQNTWGNVIGALQNYAGLGANAAGQLGSISGGLGSSVLGGSVNFGNTVGGTLQNIGGSTASGILGSANALAGGVMGTGNALSSAALLYGLGQGGLGGGAGGGLYSGNALLNGPTNQAISNASDAQIAQYEQMFG